MRRCEGEVAAAEKRFPWRFIFGLIAAANNDDDDKAYEYYCIFLFIQP